MKTKLQEQWKKLNRLLRDIEQITKTNYPNTFKEFKKELVKYKSLKERKIK